MIAGLQVKNRTWNIPDMYHSDYHSTVTFSLSYYYQVLYNAQAYWHSNL
jgi:hypothetical protein